MPEGTADTKPQSLGELVAALRAGAPCPWCGAGLQSGTALRQVQEAEDVTSANRLGEETSRVILYCPECGSEVCMAGTTSRSRHCGLLVAAA
jgi:predicted RNA-binding Zn-ribbon protein involved in translation (DUF1610 family)